MIMINFRNILALTLLVCATFAFVAPAFAGGFAIVVNTANSTSAEDVNSEIRNLYLKKQTAWSNGIDAVPLAREADSPEHEAFLAGILEMSQGDLDGHWASEKSKTGATGPREVGSKSILLRQIGRKEGAFGVVSEADAASLPEGVKILKTF